MTIRASWLVVLAAPLAACGLVGGSDGPSQQDIADALGKTGLRVKSAERIACKPAPDRPGFVCDFRVESCGQFTGKCDRSATRTGRFVKFGDNWVFRDDVADPNRAMPAPLPSPTPSAEPSATVTGFGEAPPPPGTTPTPLPSPTPSPRARATPAPSPMATSAPKTLPTPKASPTPKPRPTATARPGGVSVGWLSGRWGAGDGDCDARRAVKFSPGGGFYGRHGIGSWKLRGRTVTVSGRYSDGDKPFAQTLGVERIDEDAMTMEGKRYHRCPA